jgi:hypothetical protein
VETLTREIILAAYEKSGLKPTEGFSLPIYGCVCPIGAIFIADTKAGDNKYSKTVYDYFSSKYGVPYDFYAGFDNLVLIEANKIKDQNLYELGKQMRKELLGL